jgi:hypothetical protein
VKEINWKEKGVSCFARSWFSIAKGPFNKTAKHIDAVLDQSDLATSSDLSEKTIGLEDIYQRQITKELLSSKRHSEVDFVTAYVWNVQKSCIRTFIKTISFQDTDYNI